MSVDNQTKQPWDLEHFKMLETALRMQGVKKPLSKEFYESFNELNAYIDGLVAQAETRGKLDEQKHTKMWQRSDGTYVAHVGDKVVTQRDRIAELEASLKEGSKG